LSIIQDAGRIRNSGTNAGRRYYKAIFKTGGKLVSLLLKNISGETVRPGQAWRLAESGASIAQPAIFSH
jgi:hypothetical protein